jgi:hypothetical protein
VLQSMPHFPVNNAEDVLKPLYFQNSFFASSSPPLHLGPSRTPDLLPDLRRHEASCERHSANNILQASLPCIFLHLTRTIRALKYPDPFSDQGDDEEDIKAQLRSTLRQDLGRTLQSRRPLLTHLNPDTTWLLSLPILLHVVTAKSKKRKRTTETEANDGDRGTILGTVEEMAHVKQYFHILIDPWLKGS